MSGRWSFVNTAAALAVALAFGWTIWGAEGPAEAASPATAPVVGEVTSLAGNGSLRVVPAGGGKAAVLREGSKLQLGDVINPGHGVSAKIALTIPRGVSSETELVFVRPGDDRPRTIELRRTDSRSTTVTISD
jgi:hypothetical protein